MNRLPILLPPLAAQGTGGNHAVNQESHVPSPKPALPVGTEAGVFSVGTAAIKAAILA